MAAETGAIVFACERARAEDLERLADTVERMAAAEDFAEYRRLDTRFHIGIAEAARSPRLVTAMTEAQGNLSDLLARIAHPQQVLTRSNSQHRRLVGLLARRDVPRAVRLMRDHTEGTEHILAGLLPAPADISGAAERQSPLQPV